MKIKKSNSILTKQLFRLLVQRLDDRSQGFTLVEVMVSIVLMAAFMGATMTALATASLVKASANGATVATNWIEEDLEAVRAQAALISYSSNTSRCNATTTSAGFADALSDVLPSVPHHLSSDSNSGTQTVGGKTYALDRDATIVATAPFEVLQLTYTVSEVGKSSPLTTMYTEVIPNAAFQCSRF